MFEYLKDPLLQGRDSMNETNDCVIIAISLVTKIPYKEVHAIFAEAGRKPRTGLSPIEYIPVLRQMGYKIEVEQDPRKLTDGSRFTGKTIQGAKRFKTGRHLVRFKRHLAALIDGQLMDWVDGKRKIVEHVFTPIKVT